MSNLPGKPIVSKSLIKAFGHLAKPVRILTKTSKKEQFHHCQKKDLLLNKKKTIQEAECKLFADDFPQSFNYF